jgi:hypothetical protein
MTQILRYYVKKKCRMIYTVLYNIPYCTGTPVHIYNKLMCAIQVPTYLPVAESTYRCRYVEQGIISLWKVLAQIFIYKNELYRVPDI